MTTSTRSTSTSGTGKKTIRKEDRTLDYLKKTVRTIYKTLLEVEQTVYEKFPHITPVLPPDITFVHAEELARLYPDKTPRERETIFAREHGAIFIIGIGAPLSDGQPHDGRSPDYDDWISLNEEGYQGLNGDIILWNPVLDIPFEISSMGIRVSPESLREQLKLRECPERSSLTFHRLLLEGKLPYSIGGGIGRAACACSSSTKHTSVKSKHQYGLKIRSKHVPMQASNCSDPDTGLHITTYIL